MYKMKQRTIIAFVFTIIMVLSSISIVFAYDNGQETNKHFDRTYSMTEITEKNDLSKINKTDVIKMNGSVALAANQGELNRLLEKGKINIVENINQTELSALSQKLEASFCAAKLMSDQQTIGAVITKDASGKINVTEVIAEVADELINGKLVRTDKYKVAFFLEWIGKNTQIDVDTIYADYIFSSAGNVAKGATASFGEVSKYRYLYTAPYQENSTEYESVQDSNRYLLATTKIDGL